MFVISLAHRKTTPARKVGWRSEFICSRFNILFKSVRALNKDHLQARSLEHIFEILNWLKMHKIFMLEGPNKNTKRSHARISTEAPASRYRKNDYKECALSSFQGRGKNSSTMLSLSFLVLVASSPSTRFLLHGSTSSDLSPMQRRTLCSPLPFLKKPVTLQSKQAQLRQEQHFVHVQLNSNFLVLNCTKKRLCVITF